MSGSSGVVSLIPIAIAGLGSASALAQSKAPDLGEALREQELLHQLTAPNPRI